MYWGGRRDRGYEHMFMLRADGFENVRLAGDLQSGFVVNLLVYSINIYWKATRGEALASV